MQSALKAGFLYFAIVFAVGFAIGTIRVLTIVPQVGEAVAIVIEVPFILAISWLASRWLIGRCEAETRWMPRLVMRGVAFACLMTIEFGGAMVVVGRTLCSTNCHVRNSGLGIGPYVAMRFCRRPARAALVFARLGWYWR